MLTSDLANAHMGNHTPVYTHTRMHAPHWNAIIRLHPELAISELCRVGPPTIAAFHATVISAQIWELDRQDGSMDKGVCCTSMTTRRLRLRWEDQLHKIVFWPLYVYHVMCPQSRTHTHTSTHTATTIPIIIVTTHSNFLKRKLCLFLGQVLRWRVSI